MWYKGIILYALKLSLIRVIFFCLEINGLFVLGRLHFCLPSVIEFLFKVDIFFLLPSIPTPIFGFNYFLDVFLSHIFTESLQTDFSCKHITVFDKCYFLLLRHFKALKKSKSVEQIFAKKVGRTFLYPRMCHYSVHLVVLTIFHGSTVSTTSLYCCCQVRLQSLLPMG